MRLHDLSQCFPVFIHGRAHKIVFHIPTNPTYDNIYRQEKSWQRRTKSITPELIHLVVCLTTGPKPLPKRALHLVRSRVSFFKWEYPLISLISSSSFLLPTSSSSSSCHFYPSFIFPLINRCRRQFLCKMWPIQLAFRLLISCRIFLCSLTVSNTSSFLTCWRQWPSSIAVCTFLINTVKLYSEN
jgi:hypothetical protein